RRRPPSSPLFPYTTLFRSGGAGAELLERPEQPLPGLGGPLHEIDVVNPPEIRAKIAIADLQEDDRQALVARDRQLLLAGARCQPDRKSTRLNSSHDQISYA